MQLVPDNINTGNNFINSNLAGIAVGNLDDSNPGKEIATINNSANGNIEITIYSFANSVLTQRSIFTLATGSYSQWNGITAGDFDGDGIDEIIAHREYDGDFYIFKLNSVGQIINDYKESFPANQQNGVMGSGRFSFNQGKDLLITLRNYDGNMFLWSMDGLCQGLDLNNISVNENYMLGGTNNYPADYHVHNTLTASNYIIESGYSATFTAGKKIVLGPGFHAEAGSNFHAYIDEVSLACNSSVFRIAPNHCNEHPETSNTISILPTKEDFIQSETPVLKKDEKKQLTNFTASVNEKKLTLNFETENEVHPYNISVYSMIGSLVYHTTISNSSQEINLSNQAAGFYSVKIYNNSNSIVKMILVH